MIFQASRRVESLLSEIPYATFSNCSPRGSSQLSGTSKIIRDQIKAGHIELIKSAFPHFQTPQALPLQPFLNTNATLIPVPKSSLFREGTLWPAKLIADLLLEAGFGREVLSCIERVTAIRSSSQCRTADERPSVREHYDSIQVRNQLIHPANITLIDDVLTLGRTAFACAQRLNEAFPDAEIRFFSMVRTQSLVENIEILIEPSVGTIRYNPRSGKTTRNP